MFITGVNDTGDKLFSGVNDTGENFSLFSPVSLTPLINIHSRISLRIFEKIRNDPNGILRGPGDTDLWKKPEVENLVSDSL